METDNDYDVAADYLDAAKLKAYIPNDGQMQRVRQSFGLRVQCGEGRRASAWDPATAAREACHKG